MKNLKFEDFKNNIKNKKVAFLGIGTSNIPAMKYLMKLGAVVTAFDKKDAKDLGEVCLELEALGIKLVLGEKYLDELIGFDYIFRSPSARPDLPQIEKEIKMGAILTSEIEMVVEMCPGRIIGITGSAGKTTTTTLIYEMLKLEGLDCYLGGNIGIPLFDKIDNMKEDTIVVLELSSFQLMTMKKSPHVAVVTSLAPDHLDVHKSFEEYIEAKKNIMRYQTQEDILVLNYDNELVRDFSKDAKAQIRFFSENQKLNDGAIIDDNKIKIAENKVRTCIVDIADILMVGKFNVKNLCAAMLAVKDFVSIETMKKIAITFTGVEHRMQYICEKNGIKYVNNSIASSPIKAISSLEEYNKNLVLIVGGSDKFSPFDEFAKVIIEKARVVVIVGATKEKIKNAIDKGIEVRGNNNNLKIIECDNFIQAVEEANRNAISGDTVLLSPGCASFDFFKNYKERGEKFKSIVENF